MFVSYWHVLLIFILLSTSHFLISKQNRCCSIYPLELEQVIGDPILFKVRKDYDCDSCGCLSVQVLDFIIDANVVDIYLNPNHKHYYQKVNILLLSIIYNFNSLLFSSCTN
jgi:hypothetical protein